MLDKRRKRTTFLRIFSKAAVAALLISLICSVFLRHYIEYHIYNEADRELARQHSNIINSLISEETNHSEGSLNAIIPLHSYYTLDFPVYLFGERHRISVNNIYNDPSSGLIAILDENGKVLFSSKRKFVTGITFSKRAEDENKPPENGWYYCPEEKLDIPELTEFFNKFCNYDDTDTDYVDFKLKSAYVNKEKHLFIPHEITAEYTHARYNRNEYLYETKTVKTEDYTINAELEGYELTELHSGAEKVYPMAFLPTFQGTPTQKYDALYEEAKSLIGGDETWGYSGITNSFDSNGNNTDGRLYYQSSDVYFQGQKYRIWSVFSVILWTNLNNRKFAFMCGAFTLFTLIIALLYSWRKNVMNKADYAFEDYQRDLTNNLAHDLKTPLAAIGGYAENLMESAKDEKQQKYLRSILDNVAYTDSMISKTLELNSGNMQKLNKSGFDMRELAEAALGKYSVQLDERGIESAINGNMKVNTDRDIMTSAVENLVSNAVKYTRNDGEIKIDMNNGKFKITNSVSEKTDTHDLTKPFVRGDKNRSGRSGSGLGLSIAERSLNACGYVLELDCTDSEFTASIR